MRSSLAPTCHDTNRRGTALLVVLVVVTLLALAAYTFSEFMVVEARATRHYTQDAQARELASSAVDYAAALLGNPGDEDVNFYDNAGRFAAVPVVYSDDIDGEGWFTIIAPRESATGEVSAVRYGLMNESARVNINAIVKYELPEESQRIFLLTLPNMTDELADGILDWVDSDDEPRQFGTESDIYQTFTPPYFAKDAPLESVDELLMVDGMTPELLYGEDQNRNGLLDPNEDDADLSPPYDNADGVLDIGLSAFITGYSRETNLRPDESTKIDLNQSLMTDLYDEIETEFDEDIAQFMVAYRIYGAVNVEPLDLTGIDEGNTTGNTETDDALQRMAEGMARAMAGGGEGTVTRGGLDCTQGASTEVQSLFELIGAEIEAEVDGQPTTIVSPFGTDAESIAFLFDNFTTDPVTRIDGRINVNEAREDVLAGIPGMGPEMPAAIIAARPTSGDGAEIAAILAQRRHSGWLLTDGVADLLTMRLIDRYITGGGDVYRLQAVGRFTGPGPSSRIEAVIDASEDLPKVLFRRDLGDLGSGYQLRQLTGDVEE
jgi:type II secretory pathway component PulK